MILRFSPILRNCYMMFRLGIALSVIVGFSCIIRLQWIESWIQKGLYFTLIQEFARSIDRIALFVVPGLLVLWVVRTVDMRVAGRKRGIFRTAVVCGLLVALELKFGILEGPLLFVRYPSRLTTLLSMFNEDLPRLGLASLLIVGVVVFRRRKSVKMQPDTGRFRPVTKRFSISQILERRGVALSVFTAVFILANVLAASFRIITTTRLKDKPNVIVIMADTLRADHVGCFGGKRQTTPCIDALAKHSTIFNRAIAQASCTRWSVPSFMMSKYPQAMGDRRNPSPTLAEFLCNRGYRTSAVAGNLLPRNARRGFEWYEDSMAFSDITSPWISSTAVDWIRHLGDDRFFMFLLFMDAHSPYMAHDGHSFESKYSGGLSSDSVQVLGNENADEYSKGDIEHMKALYDSDIAFMDSYIGWLLEELKRRNLYDNTVIVFLADHGEEFGEHGRLFHELTLYNEVLKVPLIVKLPGQSEAGKVDGVFPLVDLFPSLLKSIGYNVPRSYHGEAHDFREPGRIRSRLAFSATDKGLRSVQDTRYKFISDIKGSSAELYDLLEDPLEKRNIIAKDPTVSSGFEAMLSDLEAKVGSAMQGGTSHDEPTDEERERLRSLGYIQ